jgi:hypothetical protein
MKALTTRLALVGRPTTAASATAGWRYRTSSISREEILAAAMIMSLSPPTIRQPRPSTGQSPVAPTVSGQRPGDLSGMSK